MLTLDSVCIIYKRYLYFHHSSLGIPNTNPICPIHDNVPYVTDLKWEVLFFMKTVCNGMVAAPQFKGGDLKISDQNNWGGGGRPEQKK